jgi:hypothetical protein
MPRINIHEVDNTKPGTRDYQNYTVVIPGFHAPYMTQTTDENVIKEANGIILEKEVDGVFTPMTDEDIFGDAGILEVKTQADFEQYVGLVKPQAGEDGFMTSVVTKTVVSTNETTLLPSVVKYFGGPNEKESGFVVEMYKDDNVVVFNYTKSGEMHQRIYKYKVNGYDVSLFDTVYSAGLPFKPAKVQYNPEKPDALADAQAFIKLNVDFDIIEANFALESKGKLTYVATSAESVFTVDKKVIIPAHYGNQIAYELLGLGYTVYYVNMGEFYPGYKVPVMIPQLDADGKPVIGADGEPVYVQKVDSNNVPEYDTQIGWRNIFEAECSLGRETFWAELRDKTTYDFRFVLTGFIDDNNGYFDLMKNANYEISKLAAWEAPGEDPFAHVRARGDVLALIDLDESAIRETIASSVNGLGNTTKRTIQAIQKELARQNFGGYGKYSAVFTPSVTYTNNLKTDFFENSRFPASFHYLACFAKSVFSDNYKEWFAVAGFTRGLSTYNIDSTAFKLGDIAVQALEPRYLVDGAPVNVACNVIVHNKGSYYIWGNRTAHALLKSELIASHFLNIRQLCITLKKFIYVLCRNFTFDPNSDILWANFKTALSPILEQMRANQGIRNYTIEKVPTDLKGVLSARVRIVPIEAVEDFEIEVALEDSVGGTTATVTE